MIRTYFDEERGERFERWLRKIVGRDSRFKHLLMPDYEEERLNFYNYFDGGLSPWQALQKEYERYE